MNIKLNISKIDRQKIPSIDDILDEIFFQILTIPRKTQFSGHFSLKVELNYIKIPEFNHSNTLINK